MKALNQEQAKRITDRVLAMSKADECTVSIEGSRVGNVRFARNSVSTAGLTEDMQLIVRVAFGKRSGTAIVNEFDDKSLEKAVRRAEELARLSPENPEFMPAISKQEYRATSTFVPATAAIDPEFRASVAATSIEMARAKKLVTAGFFTDSTRFSTIANSNGVFGHQDFTDLSFSLTARTEDGRGSGWVTRAAVDAARFDAREASEVAIEKALRSVDARALEPGRYTVILEPAATSEILGNMFSAFDRRRSADEGRSFLAKKGGGNRLGDKLFDEPGQRLGRPVGQGRTGSAMGQRIACCRASAPTVDQGWSYRLAGLLALLGAKDRQACDGRSRQHDHGGRHQVAGRADRRRPRRASSSRAPGISAWSIRSRCCSRA